MRLARAGNLLPGAVASAVGYESGLLTQPLHRGLPSSVLTFIITLNTPVLTGTSPAQALDGSAASRLDILTAGLHLRPAYIGPSPGQVGLQVSIDPRASRLILGLPAAELAGATLDGADVVGRRVSRLREQLAEATDWHVRFHRLGIFLAAQAEAAERTPAVRAEIAEAWRWLLRRGGSGRISDLAGHVHLSSRQLNTLFTREYGMGPQAVNRLLRFDRAVQLMVDRAARGEPPALAETAAASGYFDQPHFNRDFRSLAGTSPLEWLAEEHGNITAGGHRNGRPS